MAGAQSALAEMRLASRGVISAIDNLEAEVEARAVGVSRAGAVPARRAA